MESDGAGFPNGGLIGCLRLWIQLIVATPKLYHCREEDVADGIMQEPSLYGH